MKKLKLFILASLMIGAVAVASGCNEEEVLAAPTNIEYNVENELTWDQVEDAKSYLVEIINVATGESYSLTAKKTSPKVSLSFLAQGDYDIRVKALARNEDDNGEWSEAIHFQKSYETGCVYTLVNNNTEYHITKFGTAASTIYIEDKYRDKPVTGIASRAFKGYADIEYVYVGKNVKTIGDSAFYNCKNLKGVYFKDSALESIGVGAFHSCGLLEEITIPKGVTKLQESTFEYCVSLKEINLHDEMVAIDQYAFSDCTALESIEIPDSVTTVGVSAFTNCTALKSAEIGAGVSEISNSLFKNCYALETVSFSNAGNLKKISGNAFKDCNELTSVTLPEGLEDIAANAFLAQVQVSVDAEGKEVVTVLSKLEEVILPSTITHIGKQAFFGTKLYMDAYMSDKDVYVGDWLIEASYSKRNTAEVLEAKDFQDGIVGIADNAVSGCAKLNELYLPKTLKYIGKSAFRDNKQLVSVESPNDSLKDLGESAFQDCSALKYVVFGDGLETIGTYAFMGCKNLTNQYNNVIVPSSVILINQKAFSGTKLESATDEQGVIYAGNWVIGCNDSEVSSVTLKDTAVGIAEYAFANSRALQSITASSKSVLKYVGRGAFYNCQRLDNVNLRRSKVEEISEYAFYKCASLYTVQLPNTLKVIGRSAFNQCQELETLDLSMDSLEVIGERAFYENVNLQTLTLGKNIQTIGLGAFFNCKALTELSLPNAVVSIGNYAFAKCDRIISVSFGNKLTEIGAYAFVECSALKRISFPNSLQTIGNYAFFKCTALTSVKFNEGLESIGDYAFGNDAKMVSIALPSTLKNIGVQAFRGCSEVVNVLLGNNITTIGEHAFYGCSAATFYVEADSIPAKWNENWNSLNRPVVWSCELDENKDYVVSITIKEKSLQNNWAANGFVAPEYVGHELSGWATTPNSEEVVYAASDIASAPVGTTLYAVWAES